MKSVGILIRLTPYNEFDAMANVLTKDGTISFLIKNVYKLNNKNNILSTPLMLGTFTFNDNNKKILSFKEFSPIIDVRNHSQNIKILALLEFLDEITLRLYDESNIKYSYPLLYEILLNLKEELIIKYALIYFAFTLKKCGYGINIKSLKENNKTEIIKKIFTIDDINENIDISNQIGKEIINDLFIYAYNQTEIKFKSKKLLEKIF